MSEAKYNEQTLTDYLLGVLPEAEAERCDELSVSDDAVAAAIGAREKDLVDAFVRGELSGQMLERFTSYYLASPVRRERVAFAQAFQDFAERNRARVQSEGARRPGWFAALTTLLAPRPALQWGLVAGVLIVLLAGGWLFVGNLRLQRQISQSQIRRDELQQREQALQKQLDAQQAANQKAEQELAQVRAERERLDLELKKQAPQPADQTIIASLILTPGLRGTGQMQTLSLPTNSGRVAFQLNLEPNEFVGYSVVLIDQSNHQTLWHSGKLRAHSGASGKTIGVNLSSVLLKPQTYVLQVSGVSANGSAEVMSDYPFKVVK
jgi:hypothetical protein